ncbi:phosphonate ABC transporter ATP-binding protein [Micrococcoides hystricis]|uniref:Phosphonate ABC transporter ATP-binding protein n=1 Tax=Micrococcoides hystricis TaxID=1572761 RepID=A0ABV6P8X4_9MICC
MQTPGKEEKLVVDKLHIAFNGRTVLDGLSFTVRAGELVAFLGANGSGKSTTLRAVAGLLDHDGGNIEVCGVADAAERNHRADAAMVFQKIHLVPRRSVLDNVCAGALARMSTWQSMHPLFFPASIRQEAMEALERVGLADRAAEPAGKLSGGQQQRVAIARALCQRAEVLLADEPVSALDPQAAEQVMTLLSDLAHTEGLAVAAVLHQPDLAFRYADRLIGLKHGKLVLDEPASTAASDAVLDLYNPQEKA